LAVGKDLNLNTVRELGSRSHGLLLQLVNARGGAVGHAAGARRLSRRMRLP
jgi:hypothetical protein